MLAGVALVRAGEPLRLWREFAGGETLARRWRNIIGPEDVLLFPSTLQGADPGGWPPRPGRSRPPTAVVGAPGRDPALIAQAVDAWRAAGREVFYVTDTAHPLEVPVPGYEADESGEEAIVTTAVAPRPYCRRRRSGWTCSCSCTSWCPRWTRGNAGGGTTVVHAGSGRAPPPGAMGGLVTTCPGGARRVVLMLVLGLLLIAVPALAAPAPDWRVLAPGGPLPMATNVLSLRRTMPVAGVWVGTLGGGVVRWAPDGQTGKQYSRRSPACRATTVRDVVMWHGEWVVRHLRRLAVYDAGHDRFEAQEAGCLRRPSPRWRWTHPAACGWPPSSTGMPRLTLTGKAIPAVGPVVAWPTPTTA